LTHIGSGFDYEHFSARQCQLAGARGSDGPPADYDGIYAGRHGPWMKLFETSTVRAADSGREEGDMIRSVFGFAVFAVITIFLLKLVFGLFGLMLGLVAAVLWFAFLGFVFYLLLRLVAPDTAARVREMIAGD
jgi:hypothetical protein